MIKWLVRRISPGFWDAHLEKVKVLEVLVVGQFENI